MDLTELLGMQLDGKYRLDALIGKGGMGAVFRATHLGTDRVVALKLILPNLHGQEAFLARFQREARATGRLKHPNIVDLTDFGFTSLEGRNVAYLVMEHLAGCALDKVLAEEKQLPLPWVVAVAAQIASALEMAHRKGIIHRDLKPHNIWLEPDRRGGFTAKILDFGLAKIEDQVEDPALLVSGDSASVSDDPDATGAGSGPVNPFQTEVGVIMGTPKYMSPEQCLGKPVDACSDIYSLAVIVYQMLAGQTPFRGRRQEQLNAHARETPVPLKKRVPGIPLGVSKLLESALAKDPEQRPATAEQFKNALGAYSESSGGNLARVLGFLIDEARPIRDLLLRSLGLPALACVLGLGLCLTFSSQVGYFERGSGIALLIDWSLLALFWGSLVWGLSAMEGAFVPYLISRMLRPRARIEMKRLWALGSRHRREVFLDRWPILVCIGITLVSLGLEMTMERFRGMQADPVSPAFEMIALRIGFFVLLSLMGFAIWLHRRHGWLGALMMGAVVWVEDLSRKAARKRIQELTQGPFIHWRRGKLWFLRMDLGVLALAWFVQGVFIHLVAQDGGPTLRTWGAASGVILILASLGPLAAGMGAMHYLRSRQMLREDTRQDLLRFDQAITLESQWERKIREAEETNADSPSPSAGRGGDLPTGTGYPLEQVS